MPDIDGKRLHEEYQIIDDIKLRKSLIKLADRLDEKARLIVYNTYNDPVLMGIYKRWRDTSKVTGVMKKTDANHRRILEIPNVYVMDFLEKTVGAKYGDNWLQNNRALRHEYVRPWWVVEKI